MKCKLMLLALGLYCMSMIVQAQQKYDSGIPISQQPVVSRTTQDTSEGKVLYGYSDPNIGITKGDGLGYDVAEAVKVTAAIRFSEGISSLLKGRKIYRFKAGVAAKINDITVFIRKADGTTLWEKTTNMKMGWNDVVLDTPFDIPEIDELYIGYTYMQAPGAYVTAVTGTDKINGLLLAEGEADLEALENSGLGNLCLLVEVDGSKTDFDYVGSLKSVYSPCSYLPKGGDQNVGLGITFFNEGDQVVSRITLGRSLNGVEASDTVCVFKRSVKPNTIGKLTFNVSPAESTKYIFTLKKIETAAVSVSAKSANVSVYDDKNAIQRMILAEEFTSQSCGNCPAGQAALHSAMEGVEDRVALVLHHSGHKPDFFTLEESYAYCYFFYCMANTYAPAMMLNRTYISEYDSRYNTGISPVFDPRFLKADKLLEEINRPAMVSVDINNSYVEATRQLTVTVSGHKITDLVGDHVGLNVYLLESNYIAWQNNMNMKDGIQKDFEHNNFLRAVLSNMTGDVITFDGDGKYSRTYTYTIPETYVAWDTNVKTTAHPENMSLVAFVSNFDINYPDNCVVLNSNKTPTLNYSTGVQPEKAIEKEVSVYVHEGTVYLVGEYDDFQLYNMQGVAVRNEGLVSGVYLVKIMGKNHREQIQKIFVP